MSDFPPHGYGSWAQWRRRERKNGWSFGETDGDIWAWVNEHDGLDSKPIPRQWVAQAIADRRAG